MCAALLGGFPAYGRGFTKSFERIELMVGNREFSWMFEYLKRHNDFREEETLPRYTLKGLYDLFDRSCPMPRDGRKQDFARLGHELDRDQLTETRYLLEPVEAGSYVPVRIEVGVITHFKHSKLLPGHSHRDCASHHHQAYHRTGAK